MQSYDSRYGYGSLRDMAAYGIWQMVDSLGGDAEAINSWIVIIGAIILAVIGEGWRRRIVRPPDITRRLASIH